MNANAVKKIFSRIFFQQDKSPGFKSYVLDANAKYDLQTIEVITKLKRNANTIDIGAHKGDILKELIKAAPEGKHYAFEPIPVLHDYLQRRFGKHATVLPYALGDKNGPSSFNLVTTSPAYSGLIRRKYDAPEKDVSIKVEVRKLDDVIPTGVEIDFIKIDVEGGEFNVIKGAVNLLKKCRPLIIFEQGLGGADENGTDPAVFFDFMQSIGYKISLMEYYLLHKDSLTREEYCHQFWKEYNYYFIAY